MSQYGCHNRKPIATFGATTCQYTLSEAGSFDHRCGGCKEQRKSYRAVNATFPTHEALTVAIDEHLDSVRAMAEYGKGNKWKDCA